ncbi:MAG TPA: carboxymuconolactone decarboxylase family protein [Nevskiaceae bacterium]|nr:carboxymuconolactone decarboxylase family protein [Nevskiaceae bacterium]
MSGRSVNYYNVAPDGFTAMRNLQGYVEGSGLEHSLLELVKMRASQINGCAYCLDMHSKDARAYGETEQRLYGLNAWREAPYYTARERAALAWTEAVTLVSHGVPEDIEAAAHKQFSEKELVDLTYAIIAINAWNRLAIPFHAKAGDYKSPIKAAKS